MEQINEVSKPVESEPYQEGYRDGFKAGREAMSKEIFRILDENIGEKK